jgi:hypothetical protein
LRRTRRAGFALAALGSHLIASLVSFQATAETTAPPSITEVIAVRPRAPIVTRTSQPVDLDAVMAGPTLRRIPHEAAPVRVNPLSSTHGAAAVQQTTKDTSNPQAAQRRLIGFIAGSLGLAGIGLGATTSVMSLSQRNPPPDRQCADPIRICSPDGKAASGSSSLSTLSAAGWAIGAMGVTTGAVLLLTSSPKTGHETALGPDIYKRGAGLSVRRTW